MTKNQTEQQSSGDKGFQERLAQLTKAFRSQRELAQLAGISTNALSKYLLGKSEPTRPVLLAIAKAAGTSVEWLATGKGKMKQEETSEDHLYEPESRGWAEISTLTGLYTFEEAPSLLALSTDWIKTVLRCEYDDVELYVATDDSMKDTIHPGDFLLIDTSENNLEKIGDGIFVISWRDHLAVRRLQRLSGRQIKVICDNSRYNDGLIDLDIPFDLPEVAGRVIWIGHKL